MRHDNQGSSKSYLAMSSRAARLSCLVTNVFNRSHEPRTPAYALLTPLLNSLRLLIAVLWYSCPSDDVSPLPWRPARLSPLKACEVQLASAFPESHSRLQHLDKTYQPRFDAPSTDPSKQLTFGMFRFWRCSQQPNEKVGIQVRRHLGNATADTRSAIKIDLFSLRRLR
jgi:hypothetical protein